MLDIKMPRMDGMELLQKLRRSSQCRSSFSPRRMTKWTRCSATDGRGRLYKPFSQRLLIERIRTLLRRLDHANGNDQKSEGHCGATSLDPDRHLVPQPKVPLTVTEFLLIRSLARDRACKNTRSVDTPRRKHLRGRSNHRQPQKRLRAKFRQVDSTAQIETPTESVIAIATRDHAGT